MDINTAVRAFSVNHIQSELVRLVPTLRENGGHDFHTALLIMKMFESSYPELQSELGDCYYQGQGITQNIEKALDMFQKAAAKGSVRAQYDLGWYYYDRGEYMRSIDYFTFCISHKNELNDDKLCHCYTCLGDAYSKLSEPKISTAIENLAIAADKYRKGFACWRLGSIYSQFGTQYFDAEKAVRYFELGVSYGNEFSAHDLAINYIFGNEKMNIKPNGKKAESILQRFVDTDDADILSALGLLYRQGDEDNGVPKNYLKSKQFYERAWKANQDPSIAESLGYVYFCLDEYENAEKMLVIADGAGYCGSSDFLGRIYKKGYLGYRNLEKAVFYYGRTYDAGELNNVFTCAEYAELLEETGNYQQAYNVAEKGQEVYNDICFVFIKANLVLNGKVINRLSMEQAAEMMEICLQYNAHKKEACMALGQYYYSVHEYRKAEKQYMDAFSLGAADAAFFLGKLYEAGGGTIAADVNKAFECYSKAAEAGSIKGKEEVTCFKKGILGGYRRKRSL